MAPTQSTLSIASPPPTPILDNSSGSTPVTPTTPSATANIEGGSKEEAATLTTTASDLVPAIANNIVTRIYNFVTSSSTHLVVAGVIIFMLLVVNFEAAKQAQEQKPRQGMAEIMTEMKKFCDALERSGVVAKTMGNETMALL